MAIKIIKGIYGYKDVKGSIIPKTSQDDPFSLTEEQEARLVRKGVAEYVDEQPEETPQTPASVPQLPKGAAVEPPKASEETEQPPSEPPKAPEETEQPTTKPENPAEPQNQDGSQVPEGENGKVAPVQPEEKTVTGHLDKDQLSEMTYNDLKHLAKELGIPATGSKDELVEKIAAEEVKAPAEDEEEPPVLQPANPE